MAFKLFKGLRATNSDIVWVIAKIRAIKLVEKLGKGLGILSFFRGGFLLSYQKLTHCFKKSVVLPRREIQLVGHLIDLSSSSRTEQGEPNT